MANFENVFTNSPYKTLKSMTKKTQIFDKKNTQIVDKKKLKSIDQIKKNSNHSQNEKGKRPTLNVCTCNGLPGPEGVTSLDFGPVFLELYSYHSRMPHITMRFKR